MTIDKLIKELEKIRNEKGDLPVVVDIIGDQYPSVFESLYCSSIDFNTNEWSADIHSENVLAIEVGKMK